MAVTENDVLKIARLARLDISGIELPKFTDQLNMIVAYMEKLNEVDTSGSETMTHAHNLKNIYREDEITSSLKIEDTFLNAPKIYNNFFVVPRGKSNE